nr:hypothetical protein [Tanacetum cinerariifolium]
MSVKYQNYVNLTSSSEEQPSERNPSPPPRKKSLSPPQAPSISISNKSTHYTSSSSLKLPPLQMSPNDPYTQTMDNWPPGLVTDMSKVDKIKAKRTKPGTGMKRFQEIKAEGKFI